MKQAVVHHSPSVKYYIDRWRFPKDPKALRLFLRQKLESLPPYGILEIYDFPGLPNASFFTHEKIKPPGYEITVRTIYPKLFIIRLA